MFSFFSNNPNLNRRIPFNVTCPSCKFRMYMVIPPHITPEPVGAEVLCRCGKRFIYIHDLNHITEIIEVDNVKKQ